MSHDKLGSDVSEMVAEDLSHMTEYAILIIYAEDEFEMEAKSEEECLIATMQVKIANSQSEFHCLTKGVSARKTQIAAQTMPATLSYTDIVSKGVHMDMVAADKDAPRFSIDIKDDNSDLEVTLEGSNHFYGATL